ncbi:MAG: ABC transporter ATP-binding protein [Bacteroidales bacterium]|nr:ABC transporter ATP-binding protein [Bacteroidales bacterium]
MELILKNISYSYGAFSALRSISASFSSGDMVALIGQNGSGKSTLLKCINRVVDPSRGDVFLDSLSVKELPINRVAEVMAYVPQYAEQIRFSTVFDMVLLGRKPYISGAPTKQDYAKVAKSITQLGLQELAMRRVDTLSGGERQRVMIARAVAQEPKIILLDEPIANLDIKQQFAVMKLLQELALDGIIVIVAIHDIALASRFCNRAVMLKHGTLFASGGREVYNSDTINRLFDIEVDNYGSDYFDTRWLCGQQL